MFIGGCAGSTSGGIKVSRVIIFWRIMYQEIRTSFRPNLVLPLTLNGNPVDEKSRTETLHFIALSGFAVAIGTVLITLFEPNFDLVSSYTSVTATLFNIGPGLGAVGPMSNFSGLSGASHLILSGMMVLGRLEFFAVLALFLPTLAARPDCVATLPKWNRPAHVICGELDQLSPSPVVKRIAELIPGAHFHELPGTGHISNLENPAAFNAALEKALQH